MTDFGEGDNTALSGFERLNTTLEQVRILGGNILELSQSISSASLKALETANPKVAGTPLSESWPLAYGSVMRNLFSEIAADRIRKPDTLPKAPESPFIAKLLTLDKYSNHELAQAYGKRNPRDDFVANLVTWADEMDKSGWPLIVDATLDEEHRVAVYVYEDDEINRASVIANSELTKNPEECCEPDVWLSQRVVVSGDEELATRLMQATTDSTSS